MLLQFILDAGHAKEVKIEQTSSQHGLFTWDLIHTLRHPEVTAGGFTWKKLVDRLWSKETDQQRDINGDRSGELVWFGSMLADKQPPQDPLQLVSFLAPVHTTGARQRKTNYSLLY